MIDVKPVPMIRGVLPMSLILLAACGGSGGSGGGTTDPLAGPPGPNGLVYGGVGINLDDAEGTTMTLDTAGYTTAGGGATSVSTGQTVLLDSGALSGALNGTIQVAGEQVTITNGSGTTTGGDTVAVIYEDSRSGTYSGALEILVVDSGGGVVGENVFVFGFETDPTNIALRNAGSLTYTGGFQGNGQLDGTATEYEGTITLTANFTGSGNVSGSLDGTLGGATDVDMSMPAAGISGNGFGGNLNCALGCTNGGAAGGSIDGVFYGPDAEEVGGILTFDFSAGAEDYIGAGTFVLTNPTP